MLKHFKTINNNLVQLKLNYKNGVIGKPEYIQKMHNFHRYLFAYADFIKTTDIAKIEISNGEVEMTSKNTDLKMLCDKDDQRIAPIEILNFDSYESKELAMVLKLIEHGFNILDIGANLGWYSLNLSKIFPDVNIYAFEPIFKTYNYLEKNIKLNRLKNIQTFNFGFSDDEKKLDFYYYPEQSGNTSLVNLSHKKNVKKVKCLVKKVDDFVKQKKLIINFIKCDVEGAELFVFQGAMKIIKRDKPIVFAEMLRKFSAQFNYHPNEIIKLFKNVGYKCFIVRDSKLLEISNINDNTVETNFFFLHAQKHFKKINQLKSVSTVL